ncbi:MAG: hypothetical protein U9Q07_05600 [Planctomycetota bacterium]|nr:hypothetical protein [Planctomycetota bacterium]
MTGTVWDRIFANLVSVLQGIDGSADASSTVDQDTPAGATTLFIADTSGFVTGYPVIINSGGDREEVTTPVASINTGVSITFQTADYWTGLEYAHTLSQADAVKQRWYNYTMQRVESWDNLDVPWNGPFPTVGILSERENPTGFSGMYEDLTRLVSLSAWTAVEYENPTDQENDQTYQKLTGDIERALMADWTRGGYASDTRLLVRQPLSASDANDPDMMTPLVGVLLQIEIDYKHAKGSLYF